MADREAFLDQYRAELQRRHFWARAEPAQLEKFMASVEATIGEDERTWNHNSDAAKAAYLKLPGRVAGYSLKALRNLPSREATHAQA